MPNIYGSYFIYRGKSSKNNKLIIANIDTSRFNQVYGTVESVNLFNKKDQSNHLIVTLYNNSPLKFEIEIVTDDDSVLDKETRREIEIWLFNTPKYNKFKVDPSCVDDGDEDGLSCYLNCRLINPEIIESSAGVVGYKCTVESDSNMWCIDQVVSFTEGASDESNPNYYIMPVRVKSDSREYIYPRVEITIGNVGGDIYIVNETDDSNRLTRFAGLPSGARIVLDGKINYINSYAVSSNGDTSDTSYYDHFVGYKFPRLVCTEVGSWNTIGWSGDISEIKMYYIERRSF